MVTGVVRGLLVMCWLYSRTNTRWMHGCWADSFESSIWLVLARKDTLMA